MKPQRVFRPFEVKALDEQARTFSGLAAAFSLDQGGDVILPGAFKRTLADWKRSKGKVIPLMDQHDRQSVRAVVGKMIDGEETADGLQATFQLIDGPDGDEVYRRLKGEYVNGLSIGYEPVEVKMPTPDEERGGVWRFLKQLKLREVSVVIWPMNEEARVDFGTVKQALAAADPAHLPEDVREELKSVEGSIRALLARATAGTQDTPAPPLAALAPEDPRRIRMEETLRAFDLRRFGAGH